MSKATTPRGRRSSAAAALLAATCVLAACSSTPPADENPYAQDIALALEHATADFERRVLADGEITREEYEEAHLLWLTCMEQTYPPGGELTVELVPVGDGMYNTGLTIPPSYPESQLFDDDGNEVWTVTSDRCADGTIATIAGLYQDMVTNPERNTYAGMVVACLTENGIVDASYTEENYLADGAAASERANPGTNLDEQGEPAWEVSQETGLDWHAPEVQQCVEHVVESL